MTMADQAKIAKYPRQLDAESVEIRARIDQVVKLIIAGWSNRKIAAWAAKEYGISQASAFKYIHDAVIDIQEANATFDIDELKQAYVERIEDWMSQAIASKNLKLAMQLQEMLNKMNRMYVDQQEVKLSANEIHFAFDTPDNDKEL